MSFSVENLEFYLLVLMRVSGFVVVAPFIGYSAIPTRVKVVISVVITMVIINIVPVQTLEYTGVIGYSALIVKECVVGLVLGYMANVCFYIVNFAGQLMDMEIGLSMASMMDPLTNLQVTVSGEIYTYFIMMVLIVTNMHYYIIRAIIDSFQYFNVGKAVFSESLKDVMLDFMPNYFIIGFRIVLPIFGCMLLINVVLGVLAKAAPQMNMFIIGLQLKVLVGLAVVFIMAESIPTVADFIFNEARTLIDATITAFTPK